MGPAIWLRTHYAPGSNLKHEMLVADVDMDNAVDGDHRLLNDHHLYNYGPDWQRVFHVLPELLENYKPTWESYEQAQREAVGALKAYTEGGVPRARQTSPMLVHNLTGGGYGGGPGFQGQQLEDEIARALQSQVHSACVVTWLVLEDEEALRRGKVAVMFVDAGGNVVRSSRVEARVAEDMGGFWASSAWTEVDEWVDGEFGPEYQSGGSRGGFLLENMRNA
ncbi:MAG: hypothetical protein LQ344_004840 [Seirophora lacunosa]|nr:MAG: hypothetical protein LQ344_004840 [Seirophora lacunosa]